MAKILAEFFAKGCARFRRDLRRQVVAKGAAILEKLRNAVKGEGRDAREHGRDFRKGKRRVVITAMVGPDLLAQFGGNPADVG